MEARPQLEERHEPEPAHVAVSGLWMGYGDQAVFRGLDCSFPRGRLSSLVGASGSGKSTLLRLIAGLTVPQAGSIRVAGEEVTRASARALRGIRRRLGMTFQRGALFDSMTVFDNLALPLREHTSMDGAEIEAAVRRRLEEVGLPEAAGLLPRELSGGMVKRVALARAIIQDPEILLCDEPFGDLDPQTARRIEALLDDLNRRHGLTMIVASHHLRAALRMSHRLVYLVDGAALSGSPQELARRPDPRLDAFLRADLDDPPPPSGARRGAAGGSGPRPGAERR